MPRASLTLFASSVQRMLSRMRREAMTRIRQNPLAPPPRFGAYLIPWTEAMQPMVAPWVDRGGKRAIRRLEARLAVRRVPGGGVRASLLVNRGVQYRAAVVKAKQSPLRALWNLLHPRVSEAIRRITFDFIRDTAETTWKRITAAQRKFRRDLNESLGEGEALQKLVTRIAPLFGRERAYTIARTESARAVETGGMIAAQESGVVKGKKWMCAPECCDRCIELGKLKPVGVDEPFIVLPGGGPYAVVLTAPLHPHCRCTTEWVLKPEYAP